MWDFLVSKPKHYTSEDVHGAVIASTLAILERIKTNVEKASLPVNEVLRKYQELNKFIAENVNLGTLTESKEAVS